MIRIYLLSKAQFPQYKRLSICLLTGSFLLLVCPSTRLRAQQKNDIEASSLQPREILSGTASLTNKQNKPQEVRATVSRWVIPPHKRIAEFPTHGFLLIQLRAGVVITVMEGKEERHVTGNYWVAPATAQMSIQCVGEACTLDVVNFSLP